MKIAERISGLERAMSILDQDIESRADDVEKIDADDVRGVRYAMEVLRDHRAARLRKEEDGPAIDRNGMIMALSSLCTDIRKMSSSPLRTETKLIMTLHDVENILTDIRRGIYNV